MFYHLKSEYITAVEIHHFGSFHNKIDRKKLSLCIFMYTIYVLIRIDELYLDMS